MCFNGCRLCRHPRAVADRLGLCARRVTCIQVPFDELAYRMDKYILGYDLREKNHSSDGQNYVREMCKGFVEYFHNIFRWSKLEHSGLQLWTAPYGPESVELLI